MDGNTQVFKRKWLVLKDFVTYNSELNPGLCAQCEEGIIIDSEGASVLVCDCASLAPGPLLNTFKVKKKKCDLKIYMIKNCYQEKICFPFWLVFLIEEFSLCTFRWTCAFQLQLYSKLPTQLVNKNCCLNFISFSPT